MSRQTRPPKGLLAQRLDQLFRTVHPKDRGPYTPGEVADAINSAAGERVVSATYLWLLRTGERDNPTLRHLTAIAKFAGQAAQVTGREQHAVKAPGSLPWLSGSRNVLGSNGDLDRYLEEAATLITRAYGHWQTAPSVSDQRG
jgi:hypothetical protein